MKRILFVAACAAWMWGSLSAQTVQIKTAKGETKIYNLSQVESITFSDQPKTEALVTMEVINISAYSFDLNVTKAASCQKYMATVYRKDIYSESAFIDAAEQTLDPQAYYRPFEKTLCYDSKTFSESELGLNSVASEDGKTEPQYIAAIYAIDDLGEHQVYTREFSVPAKPVVESTEKATVTIDEATLTYNHLDFKVSCGWNTAKVIYAVTQPSYISTSLTPAVWNAMSQENKEARLLSVYQGIPEKYKSGMKGSYSCNANSTCIVYAIPIDKDGKIGKMDIKTINTGAVPVTGKGNFTGMTAVPQTTWESYSFNVQVDANTVAYRLMWFTETDEKNSEYISRINEIFFDTKYQEYGMWKEYNAEETSVDMGIYRPGDNYYLYGATVDRFGNISTPVNLGEKYLGTKLISTMKKTVDEE